MKDVAILGRRMLVQIWRGELGGQEAMLLDTDAPIPGMMMVESISKTAVVHVAIICVCNIASGREHRDAGYVGALVVALRCPYCFRRLVSCVFCSSVDCGEAGYASCGVGWRF